MGKPSPAAGCEDRRARDGRARSAGAHKLSARAPDLLLSIRDPRPHAGDRRAVPDLEPQTRGDTAAPAGVEHPPERQVLSHLPGGDAPRDSDRAAVLLPQGLDEDRGGGIPMLRLTLGLN